MLGKIIRAVPFVAAAAAGGAASSIFWGLPSLWLVSAVVTGGGVALMIGRDIYRETRDC